MTLPTTRIIGIIILLVVTSCANKPIFARFGGNEVSSDHSPEFQQGWNDGCKTGEAVYGNQYTKAFRDYTRDPHMIGVAAYESAWIDAYNFCRQIHNTGINNWDNDWWGILTLQ